MTTTNDFPLSMDDHLEQVLSEESVDTYLPPTRGNLPTRTLCKALAIALAGKLTPEWKNVLEQSPSSAVKLFLAPNANADNLVQLVDQCPDPWRLACHLSDYLDGER